MSVSEHPIALSLERRVDEPTRLLATVMGLPLVDGIFPALVIAGALDTATGVVETGLLVFGGSATVAIVLAEMEDPREAAPAVLLIGAALVPLAVIEAALAPTFRSVLAFDTFRRFAGLVIVAVAAKTASARVGEYLPRPAVIVGLGAVASLQPAGLTLAVTTDPAPLLRAGATAAVGVGFALAVALLGPRLRGSVDLDLFRFGSAVALGMLALSVLGLMPTEAPVALGVLGVTAVFAFDPGGAGSPVADADHDAAPLPGNDHPDEVGFDTAGDAGTVTYPIDPAADARDGSEGVWPSDEDSRAPWL